MGKNKRIKDLEYRMDFLESRMNAFLEKGKTSYIDESMPELRSRLGAHLSWVEKDENNIKDSKEEDFNYFLSLDLANKKNRVEFYEKNKDLVSKVNGEEVDDEVLPDCCIGLESAFKLWATSSTIMKPKVEKDNKEFIESYTFSGIKSTDEEDIKKGYRLLEKQIADINDSLMESIESMVNSGEYRSIKITLEGYKNESKDK